MVPDGVALHGAILAIALLYSSVGHAGASGYIAAMTLCGLAAPEIRPAALMMNMGVAALGTWHFVRAGHFRSELTWPFLVAGLPAAYVGGRVPLPGSPLAVVLGLVLLLSAIRFLLPVQARTTDPGPPAASTGLLAGVALGLLAGLTGTGGGIFLTPLLLVAGWATPKTAAAASIVFIAGNSASGLLGFVHGGGSVPWHLASLFPLALAGGFVGSRLGSLHLSSITIRRLLAAVLLVAAAKLLLGAVTS